MAKKIRVMIVDDSALVRMTLKELLEADGSIEVVATAADPFHAARKLKSEVPDVITLDVEMPRMDGLTFLKKIMSQHPIPVVIVSSLTENSTATALNALEFGAVEVVAKPRLLSNETWADTQHRLCEIIKAAAIAKVNRKSAVSFEVRPKLSADAVLPKRTSKSMIKTTEKVIAVGASTGGTQALRVFLEAFPADSPGILIVQHMPEVFTKSFANRLNGTCKITVKEAEDGDIVLRGRALIAPGNHHMLLKRSGAQYYVEVQQGPFVNRLRPSVDVLFRSTATFAGRNSVGVLLTGMGADGAKGLLEMKEAGAVTVAQNEKSCVVFGMPKEAIKLGAADEVLTLTDIAPFVLKVAAQS